MSATRRERRQDKRRYQKFLNKEWNVKLWSVPQPHVHSFESRGYESLYHFTCGDRLNDILKYGIIFGDVLMRDDDGFNAPCFTTEGHKHNPMFFPEETTPFSVREGLIRLTVESPKDQDNLINLGWFDSVYCHKYIKDGYGSHGKLHKKYGDIDKQYFYKGHIEPSKISGIKIWDEKTKKWERLRKTDKERICSKYENAKYPLMHEQPNQLRIIGFQHNDYTGMVHKYNYENADKDIFQDFYVLSDFICWVIQQNMDVPQVVEIYSAYKKSMMESFEKRNFTWEDIIEVLLDIIHFYNLLLKGIRYKEEEGELKKFPLEEIEWEEYANKFVKKYGEYRKWLIDYRKKSLDEVNLDDYLVKCEDEEEKVA